MTSTSQLPAASAHEDELLTLDLNSQDKAKYEEFIKSLISVFRQCEVEEDLRNFDEEGVDEELESKIEKCFPKISDKIAASPRQKKWVGRTFSQEELKGKNWLFKVRLKHGGRDLDILIKKNNVYLVGYKGKYKENDGTVNAEYWIVLKGKNHEQVVESVTKFLPSSKSYLVLVQI